MTRFKLIISILFLFLISLASALPTPILINTNPVNYTITPSTYSTYSYQAIGMPYQVYFKNNSNSADAILFMKDGYTIKQDVSGGQLLWYAKPNQPTASETLGGGVPSNSQNNQIIINNSNHKITYPNAYSNIELTYELKEDRLKENYKLTYLPSIKNYTYLRFEQDFIFNKSLKICANNQCYIPSGNQDDFNTSGKIELRDINDKVIFNLEAPEITINGQTFLGIYNLKGSNAQMKAYFLIPTSILLSTSITNSSGVYFLGTGLNADPTISYEWINNVLYIYDTDTYDRGNFTIEIYSNGEKMTTPDLQWSEPITNTENEIDFYPRIQNISYPISNITFRVNKLSEENCYPTGFYTSECKTTTLSFEEFETKNNITNKVTTGVKHSVLECLSFANIIEWSQFIECRDTPYAWDISYLGNITDLDPSLVLVYSTTSGGVINLNNTNITSNGVGIILNSTGVYNGTYGSFDSLVFYNSTAPYWQTTLGIKNTVATGGTISYSGGYTYHTFTSGGTFTVLAGNLTTDIIVVAGGGGGGGSAQYSGGGGGGGGAVINMTQSISAGSYAVTVGSGGGAGTASINGGNGTNSSFVNVGVITIQARGGGGGGGYQKSGSPGGSGGGGGGYGSGAGGTGNPGKNGGSSLGGNVGGAGGGGMTVAGTDSSGYQGRVPGAGGAGINVSWAIVGGSPTAIFGGGGGGGAGGDVSSGGTGGSGGGGAGGASPGGVGLPGTAGTANTGGGGGGAGDRNPGTSGGAGGTGIVIVRYLTPTATTNVTLQYRTGNTYNITDSGLVSFWSFNNDNATTAIDELGRNNGARQRSIANASEGNGTIGKGYYMSSYQVISVPDSSSLDLNTTFTLSAWVYPQGASKKIMDKSSYTFGWNGSYNPYLILTGNEGAELTTNGNMEADANWINYGTPTTNARSTEQKYSGTYSRKIVSNGGYEGAQQNTSSTLSSGGLYKIGCWFYSSSGVRPYINWHPAGGDAIGNIYGSTTYINQWVYSEYYFLMTSTAKLGMELLSENGAMTAYFDDISLVAIDANATLTSSVALTPNQLQHVVATYNGTDVQFFINGNLVSTSPITISVGNTNEALILGGGYSTSAPESFNVGMLDEVRVYNRSLSATEIVDLYNLGSYHISDWSAWSSETTATDNVGISTSTSGKFMQFRANLRTNDTTVSPYVTNYSVISFIPALMALVNITNPINNTLFTTGSITINATTSTAAQACLVSLDDYVTNYTMTLNASATGAGYTNASIGDGSYTAKVYCNTSFNNANTSQINFRISTIPPTFTNLQANETSAVTTQYINYSVQVFDNTTNVNSVWLQNNFEPTILENVTWTAPVNNGFGFGNITSRGQMFRFTQDNLYLTHAQFNINYDSVGGTKGDVYANLYLMSGTTPTGNNLTAPVIVPASAINGSKQWIYFNFTKPYLTTNTSVYAVVLSSPNSEKTTTYRINYFSGYGGSSIVQITNLTGTWGTNSADLMINFTGSQFLQKNETSILINDDNASASIVKQMNWALDTPFTYSFCANDTYGYVNCSTTNNIYVSKYETPDTTPPTGSIIAPPNNTRVNGNLTIDGTAGADSIYASMQYMNSTVAWTNLSGCNALTSPFDCVWETALFSNASDGYDIRIVPCDGAGNCNYTTIPKRYIRDQSAPFDTLYVIYPTGQMSIRDTQTIVLKMNITDGSGAGVNRTEVDLSLLNGTGNTTMLFESGNTSTGQWSFWNLSVVLSGTSSGANNIPFIAYDGATPTANIWASTFPVLIDNIAPSLDSLSRLPIDPIYNDTLVSFYAVVQDNLNISYYKFESNFTGDWTNDTINLSGGTDLYPISIDKTMTSGSYAYRWHVYDNAGNVNISSMQYITILTTQTSYLVVNIIEPLNEANITTRNVTFSYNYTNGTADSCMLYLEPPNINTKNLTTGSPANDTTLYFYQNFTDGSWTWKVGCNNSEGSLFETDTRTFTLDTTNPSAILNAPVNYYNFSGIVNPNINFSVNASDVNGLVNATLYINEIANETYTYAYGTTTASIGIVKTLSDGYYNWSYLVYDKFGNSNQTATRYLNITVDAQPPSFTTIPNNVSFVYNDGNSLGVLFAGTDDKSNPMGWAINWSTIFSINQSGWLQNISILNAGTYIINVSINDTLGNSNYTLYQVEVNKSTQTAILNINETSPKIYGIKLNITCNGELWSNTNNITNQIARTLSLGVGNYNFSCKKYATDNYYYDDDNETFDITQASRTCTLATNLLWTRNYTTVASSTTCSVSAGSSDGTMNFTKDNIGISTPDSQTDVGNFNYTCSWLGGLNYSDCAEQTNTLIIQKGNPPLVLSASPSWSVQYGTGTSVEGTGCPAGLTCYLNRNATVVSNPDAQILAIGVYTYLYNVTGNSNWNDYFVSNNLIVSANGTTTTTTTSVQTCRYKKLGYYNLKLVWIKQAGCI